MIAKAQRFPYSVVDESLGMASSLPYLPMTLTYQGISLAESGLLDTGATVNVLPFGIGRQLGAAWAQQIVPVRMYASFVASRHLRSSPGSSELRTIARMWFRAHPRRIAEHQVRQWLVDLLTLDDATEKITSS